MPFNRHSFRILPGSLNLLNPADAQPEQDSPVITNWRTDKAGTLESRRGSVALAAVTAHSLHRHGNYRYAGVGSNLLHGTNYQTVIAAGGFDGTALSFAAYQAVQGGARQFSWVMNRGRRVRVDSINAFNWGIQSPGAPVTGVAGSLAITQLATFDGIAEGWSIYQELVSVPFASPGLWFHDTVNRTHGSASLSVMEPIGGPSWQIRRDGISPPIDFRVAGQANSDDKIEFDFWVDDPSAVAELHVELQSGTAVDKPGALCIVKLDRLAMVPGWTNIQIRRRFGIGVFESDPQWSDLTQQIAEAIEREDFDRAGDLRAARAMREHFIVHEEQDFFREAEGFDWSSVSVIAFQVKTTKRLIFKLDNLRVFGGTSASLEGDAYYYCTFANDEEHESNPSPISAPIRLNKQPAQLTIPVSSDAQVTKRYIYRIGAGLSRPLRILTVAGNVITTVTDNIPNEAALDLNVPVEMDNNLPPAARGVAGPYFGRLVAYSTADNESRLFWTPTAQPWKFPGSGNPDRGNWVDVGGEGDPILFVSAKRRALFIYKTESIHRISGDLDGPVVTELSAAGRGVVGTEAVAQAADVDYFVSHAGVFRFNGESAEEISAKIRPIFFEDYVNIGNVSIPPISRVHIGRTVLKYAQGRLYLSYVEANAENVPPNTILVYDLASERWSRMNLASGGGGAAAILYEPQQDVLVAAATGSILQLNINRTDALTAIPLEWQSQYLDFGTPGVEKVFDDVVIDFQTAVSGEGAPSTLTVHAITSNGTVTLLGTLSAGTRTTVILRPPSELRGTNLAIRIEGQVTTTCYIYRVDVHWYVEARRARSFDSGVIDLGTPSPKQIEQIQVEINSTSTVTWVLSTDVPTGSMAVNQTNVIAGGSRRPVTVRTTQYAEARRLRIQFSCAPGQFFQIHRLAVKVRSLPALALGVTGEIDQTSAREA